MTKSFFLILTLATIKSFAQQTELAELESQKTRISKHIEILTDSIKVIELKITAIKSKEIQKMVTDSSLRAYVISGAKLKKTGSTFGEVIIRLAEDKEVVILDYQDGYFGVCTDSVCGYMSDLWIKESDKINEFVKAKEAEIKELNRLKQDQRIKTQKEEYAALEKNYIKKYGQKTYEKLKKGNYWIGMNKQMAIISLGSPKDINRTVGPWGVHEQWVYNSLYLYFENGKLTSYQN